MRKRSKAKKIKKITKATKKKQQESTTEVQGFLVLTASVVTLISLYSFSYTEESHNLLGLMGHSIGWFFHALFGLGSYFLCAFTGWVGWRLMFNKSINRPAQKTVYAITFLTSLGILLSVIEERYPNIAQHIGHTFYPSLWKYKQYYHAGGAPFYYLYRDLPAFNLLRMFNDLGIALIFLSTLVASSLFLAKMHPKQLLVPLFWMLAKFKKSQKAENPYSSRFVKLKIPKQMVDEQELLAIKPETNLKERPSLSQKQRETHFAAPVEPPPQPKKTNKREVALAAQRVYNGDFACFVLPQKTLLSDPKKVDQSALKKNLRRQAEVLEETLASFSIEAKVGQINCGPTITSFEVHPAIGVKVQKIKALENDLALNMEARSIRIIAPIPGKAAVGIEVPNPEPQEVAFKDILTAYQQGNRKFHIPILLGKSVNGEYVMNDLAKMPHCIIAGATGSGKSVCINTIVMSILLNAKPDEVKLLMVDPKKVELTPYSKLPHMIAPVITEPQGACAALHWLVKEMEKRYEILKQIGVRNIHAFNTRAVDKDFEDSLGCEIPIKLPYIVGIIDELADLMMVSSNDIETPIARIAQMARAVGIHLILATQRPSREVITGIIKANFPTRISFKVSSRINSQIVLDETGAETLLGNGDMLFLPPGASHLIRAQGAFIRDDNIMAVVKHICDQAPPNYEIKSFDAMDEFEGIGEGEKPTDNLYDDALEIICKKGSASTTYLQQKLQIGYARAARLIDQLEEHRVIGPAQGSKPREVLIKPENEQAQDTALELEIEI